MRRVRFSLSPPLSLRRRLNKLARRLKAVLDPEEGAARRNNVCNRSETCWDLKDVTSAWPGQAMENTDGELQ